MRALILLLVGFALAAPATPVGKRPGMRMAAAAMQGGSMRSAIRLYEKQVERNPDAPAPNVALGRAYAKAGYCRKALDRLWPWVGTVPFGHRAALAASTCSARLGLHADAILFDRIALEEKPGSTGALTAYALDLYAVGDLVSAGEVMEMLAIGLPGPRDRSYFVLASEAVRGGDVDTFDTILQLWAREGTTPSEAHRLSAQLWLDLDDPREALRTLGARGRQVALRPMRAEAERRLGEPDEALRTLDMRVRGHAEGILADAVRARVLVDLGELDEADAVLDEWEGTEEPELVASAWYLAHARHDDAAAARLAETYGIVQESRLRTLDRLAPLDLTPP